ncbi:hypothetical protein L207DRAFT_516028 [Hyaloscypha variabilis F]|uniref:Wax synthase domain-containing protein n=1 Tax=Hyaloscypha variabilis (strain UAMH 11265 / GT02V1 / F) TaxID=1149755 RepID=A0A2J6RCV0_HYAVF|nr:hypothetical protein L207DRAFT_516028 [Hyaloscypha variabilis F]
MFPSFVPDKARPLARRYHLIPSIFAVCLAGTVLPPNLFNILSVTTSALYLSVQIPAATSGTIPEDYMLPIQALLFITQWVDFCVVHSPAEFSRDKDKEKVPKTWLEKLRWSWSLNTTFRGIGWNWKVKNVPEAAPLSTTRWAFVRTEVLKACAWYLLFDLCFYPINSSRYATASPPDFFSDSLLRQAFLAWMVGIGDYCTFNLQYSLGSALLVAVSLCTPQDCPPLMGRLREVSTVRDFWGKFWHQNLRRRLTLPFNLLTKYITIPRGTLVSRYTQLYLTFIATTLVHHSGAMNITSTSSENNLNQVAFFMLQPVAITFEDFVIYLGKKAEVKESRLTRALGSLWTFAWFTYTLRYAFAFLANTGMFATSVLPSVIQGTLGLIKRYSGGPGLKEL